MKAVLLLVLTLISLQVHAYDYYKFAVELPGAVCKSKTCDSADLGNIGSNTLNMHGMWPNANDGSTIENCLTNSYDESQLSATVLASMNADWVGLYSSSATFRSHEWGKHGTCWAQQNENPSTYTSSFLGTNNLGTTYFQAMNDYFKQVLSIKNSLNIEAALFSSGSSESTITLTNLQSALSAQLGVSTIDLYCETYGSQHLITEIRFCVSLEYEPMECPTTPIIQCSTTEALTIVASLN